MVAHRRRRPLVGSPGRAGTSARYGAAVNEEAPFSVAADPTMPTRLVAVGELDAITAPVLRAALAAAGPDDVVVELDLADVTFIDSSGIQSIASALRARRAAGGDVTVVGGSRAVRRIFEVTGLGGLLADG